MAFNFPASPTNGQTYTPAGGSTYTFNGVSWITGAASPAYAPLASPVFTGDPQAPTPATADNDTSIATTAFVKAQLPASDSAEYVMVNGVWRKKAQGFDLNGVNFKDLVVPAGAKMAQLVGSVYCGGGTNFAGLQVSGDGTTFPNGATSYFVAGMSHNTGSLGFTTITNTGAAAIWLSSGDFTTLAHNFTVEVQLTRPSTSQYFKSKIYYRSEDSLATTGYRTLLLTGYVALTAPTALTLAALRIINMPSAVNFTANSYVNVTWLY